MANGSWTGRVVTSRDDSLGRLELRLDQITKRIIELGGRARKDPVLAGMLNDAQDATTELRSKSVCACCVDNECECEGTRTS